MRVRVEQLWSVLALVVIVAIVLLAFPYLVSAYYLEAAGRALDNPERSVHLLSKAIEWDSENAQAYRLLARVYREQSNWESAVEMIGKYASLRRDNPLAHAELARIYEAIEAAGATQIEDLQARIMDEWRRAGMSATNLIAAGEAARQAEQYDAAAELYRRAIQL
ncbi:MAG TPA: tetratricopeptide repeat protein, partial [Anaerolineae bacterium]|nr:tetratricopeptide repeat protein [Anaerolineae bacterium]